MKPKRSPHTNSQGHLFRIELTQLCDTKHELVKLAHLVDWAGLEESFGERFVLEKGRPGISTRLMVALHFLKYAYNLSDEAVVRAWVENPYWQLLSGMKWFEHELPIHPSSMTRFRRRIGEMGAEKLLQETLASGLRIQAIDAKQLKRVNVDTTVQEKAIRFPTDARLYDRARQRLVAEAKAQGIVLRQNYNRIGKQLLLQQSRYAHAKQMKRAKRCTKTLKTYLGRVMRDIQRQVVQPDAKLALLLNTSQRIHSQQRDDHHKVYSVHAPEVECISKGKAHKRYEFGCKVSMATTSLGGWIVGALALPGNPYDGHTLQAALQQIQRIGQNPTHVFVDQGYRGHGIQSAIQVHVDKRRRGKTPTSLWRWMKRRAAIEPCIGHLKAEHRLSRNRLKGTEGDALNVILSAAGMNFWKLLQWLRLFCACFLAWIFLNRKFNYNA